MASDSSSCWASCPMEENRKASVVGVDIVQDLLLRPGQLPGRGGKAQVHMGVLTSREIAWRCAACRWWPAGARPDTGRGGFRPGRDPPSCLLHQQKPGGIVPAGGRAPHSPPGGRRHPAQIQAGTACPPDVLAGVVQVPHLAKRRVGQLPAARDCPHREEAVPQAICAAYTNGTAMQKAPSPRLAVKHSPL